MNVSDRIRELEEHIEAQQARLTSPGIVKMDYVSIKNLRRDVDLNVRAYRLEISRLRWPHRYEH